MFSSINCVIFVECLTGYVSRLPFTNSKKNPLRKDPKNLWNQKGNRLLEITLQECGLQSCSLMGLCLYTKSSKFFIDNNLPVKYYVKFYAIEGTLTFYLEVKFYLEDSLQLTDKLSLFYYYLQIRRNIKNFLEVSSSCEQILLLFSYVTLIENGKLNEKSLDVYLGIEMSDYLPNWLLEIYSRPYVLKSIQRIQKGYTLQSRASMMKRFITESQKVPELSTHFVRVTNKKPNSTIRNTTESPCTQILLGLSAKFITIYTLTDNRFLAMSRCFHLDKLSRIKFKNRKFRIHIADMPKKYRRPIEFELESKHEAQRFFNLCCQTCSHYLRTKDLVQKLKNDFLCETETPREENIGGKRREFRESLINGDEYDFNCIFRGQTGLMQWRTFSESAKNSFDSENENLAGETNSFISEGNESLDTNDDVFHEGPQSELGKSSEEKEELEIVGWKSLHCTNYGFESSPAPPNEGEKVAELNSKETFDVPFAIL